MQWMFNNIEGRSPDTFGGERVMEPERDAARGCSCAGLKGLEKFFPAL